MTPRILWIRLWVRPEVLSDQRGDSAADQGGDQSAHSGGREGDHRAGAWGGMTAHLAAGYRERTPHRRGERNDHSTQSLNTPAGRVEQLKVP